MSYYKDLREHLEELERAGKLQRITRPINKDTELQPLVRLQFRGLPEEKRKAFLFTSVTDSKGKSYAMPVVLGCAAGSSEIYAIGMRCPVDEIHARWARAQANPIPPRLVKSGPVQEVVHQGETLKEEGLSMLPVPIATPGFDNAPYTSASNWITKDPETGVRNVGNYRGQIKAPDRIGCFAQSPDQGVLVHWQKCKDKGIPLEAAAVIGAPPNISYVAITKFPPDVDELGVAGGLAGEPVEVVKCKTVDLEVPAHAEIVIEGIIPTDQLEPEGPFGEFTGFMASRAITLFMEVTAITHRKDAIYQGFVSQFPPSESSKIRQISWEQLMLKVLRVDRGLANVQDVVFHEPAGSWGFCVIRIKKTDPGEPRKIFEAIAERFWGGKMIVVVDEDIDPRDLASVVWAMSFRMQPHRDVEVRDVAQIHPLDHSIVDPLIGGARDATGAKLRASSLFVDATRKWPYPPTSLPRQDVMERALKIWEEEGLTPLQLKHPWWGYPLGYWPDQEQEEAELALVGEFFKTGYRSLLGRRKA